MTRFSIGSIKYDGAIALLLAIGVATATAAGCGGDKPALASGGHDRAVFATRTVLGNDPRTDLVVLRGGKVTRLAGESTRPATTPATCCAAVSTDAKTLLFSRELPGKEGRADIYMLDLARDRLRRLTDDGRSGVAVLAPDGETVAFARRTRGSRPGFDFMDASQVWVMNADGSHKRRLFAGRPGVHWTPSSYSPDGESIALTRSTINRQLAVKSSIWTISADGSARHRLARRGRDAAYSPDGTQIAFASDRDRNGELCYGEVCRPATELYLMDAAGGGEMRITETADVNELLPSWSGDGQQIAYQRGVVTGNAEAGAIFVVNPDGTCRQPLAQRRNVWFRVPVWHPGSAPGSLGC